MSAARTRTSRRRVLAALVAGGCGLALLAPPVPAQSIPDPATAALALRCEQSIVRAGASFVARRLRALHGCVAAVAGCVQTRPGNGACLTRAGQRCTAALAHITKHDAPAFAATARKHCAGLDFTQVLGVDGIGFGARVATCVADFATPIGDLDHLAACLVAQHERESDLLLAVQTPRARELIALVGVSLPPASVLPAFGGSGIGDPTGMGKAVNRCTAAIGRGGMRFVSSRLRALERCAQRVHSCVQTSTAPLATGKAEKVDPSDCMPQAAALCDAQLAGTASAESALRLTIERRCRLAAVPFGTLRAASGAFLEALEEGECARFGIPVLASLDDYERCLTRQHACRVEELLLFEAPRAQELAAYAGRRARSPFCPGAAGSGLETVQSLVHVAEPPNGLAGARAVAVAPDGRDVYVASFDDDSLAAFARDGARGILTANGVRFDSVDDVDGLDGARGVAVSPDGRHVYVAASRDDAVTTFAREPASGALTFIQRRKNGAGVLESLNGARGVAVSPDGAHVYVVADPADALAVFARDAATGELTFVEREKNALGGVVGLDGPYAVAQAIHIPI